MGTGWRSVSSHARQGHTGERRHRRFRYNAYIRLFDEPQEAGT